jgi:hypothetical protein
MKKRIILLACLSAIIISETHATNYYINSTEGRDRWRGTSRENPWKSLEPVRSITFLPGDSILFACGGAWQGSLQPKGSGHYGRPIVIASYGSGPKPALHGMGTRFTIRLYNQEYWEIRDLEITNFSEAEEGMDMMSWELNNENYWAQSTTPLPHFKEDRTVKHGVLVEAEDAGALHHLHFANLEIHGVNGDMSTKHNGGIFINILGERIPTWFDGLLVEDCYIHDVDRTGVSNLSTWWNRTLTDNGEWVPSTNVVVRNNVFERSGANALIVRVADSPLVEGNLFDHCSIKGSGNANFPFNCNNALFRYNEARYTKYNIGDQDAGGFDSDYQCKNTVIEYNYSHHNEYGGILICCQGGSEGRLFNDGTIIRHNIFENNAHHTIRTAGPASNTLIADNLIILAAGADSTEVIWHKSWRGYSDKTTYQGNIYCNYGSGSTIDLGSSTGNSFENNLVIGNLIEGMETPRKERDFPWAGVQHRIDWLRMYWKAMKLH